MTLHQHSYWLSYYIRNFDLLKVLLDDNFWTTIWGSLLVLNFFWTLITMAFQTVIYSAIKIGQSSYAFFSLDDIACLSLIRSWSYKISSRSISINLHPIFWRRVPPNFIEYSSLDSCECLQYNSGRKHLTQYYILCHQIMNRYVNNMHRLGIILIRYCIILWAHVNQTITKAFKMPMVQLVMYIAIFSNWFNLI